MQWEVVCFEMNHCADRDRRLERCQSHPCSQQVDCRESQNVKDYLRCRPRNSRPISETDGQGRHRSRSREPGVGSRHEMSRDCPPHAAQTWSATGFSISASAGCCTHSAVTFAAHVASCHLRRLALCRAFACLFIRSHGHKFD